MGRKAMKGCFLSLAQPVQTCNSQLEACTGPTRSRAGQKSAMDWEGVHGGGHGKLLSPDRCWERVSQYPQFVYLLLNSPSRTVSHPGEVTQKALVKLSGSQDKSKGQEGGKRTSREEGGSWQGQMGIGEGRVFSYNVLLSMCSQIFTIHKCNLFQKNCHVPIVF